MDDILSTLPIFADVPLEERRALAGTLQPRAFAAGHVLFREDDPGDHLLIILEGDVVVFKALGTPDEIVLGTRGPGLFVG